MANYLRIKRRTSGAAGAPPELRNAELAFNEVDMTLYYGKGTGGVGGTATTIEAIGGMGAFVALTTDQVISGIKQFNASPLVPTAANGDNTTKAASTAFVQAAIGSIAIGDGDKGDITITAGVWAIDPGVVTNAKLANMGAATLKGSVAGGVPADLTVTQVKSFLSYTKADVGLGNVDNTSDANKPISSATQTALDAKINSSLIGANNGVASLGADGKLNPSQLPALAISDTFVVNSQAAMLALTAEVGDIAIRTDINKSFILRVNGASTLANWQEVLSPTAAVSSVFGRTGAVVAQTGDYTVAQITGAAPLASPTFTGTPAAPTAAQGTNTTQLATTAHVFAGLVTKANLASPTFTGTPAAPTATAGTNTTQLATTAFVTGAVGTATGNALQKANNLSDLNNVGTARGNLGLGTMATQNANAVAITGGTIDGIDLDGGTF